jgi:HAD superfamily 5'-nucleotidase-like hydrolase
MKPVPVAELGKAAEDLLESLGRPLPGPDIARGRRVYVNRNLRMDECDLIGFDMDYTLALYNQPNLEALSIACTLDKLIANRGYDESVRTLTYDPTFAVRGLVIDRHTGNILKMDRYGRVGRAYHGHRPLDAIELEKLYDTQRIKLSQPRWASIDTLFALPEVVMYAALVEHLEAAGPVAYSKLWQDIRECIDEAHRDESMKRIIKAKLPDYIVRDPDLAPTLHKLRSSGKRLFLLTNSAWDYTEAVMTHLLGSALSAYPEWRSYFDIIVVSSRKPSFFTDRDPFYEVGPDGARRGATTEAFQRGHVYEGGNLVAFEAQAGTSGNGILYIGDHIYGDMLRARKSSGWRTAMVLQELEGELVQIERHKDALSRIDDLERQCIRLDSDIAYQQLVLKSLQHTEEFPRRPGANGVTAREAAQIDAAKIDVKRRLDELKATMKAASSELARLEHEVDRSFNPYWGPIFREGPENSRFAEQVESYACVYTSRVSNFLAYSPLRYFRTPRAQMPHELV